MCLFSEIKRSNSVLEMEADLNSLETNPTLQPQVRLERLNVFPETHHSTSPQSKSSLNELEQFLYNQLFNKIENERKKMSFKEEILSWNLC